jgi:hypothetical protein
VIEARTPDGAVHQFPDGTPDAVIDGAIKDHLATPAAGAGEYGFAAAPPEETKPPPAEMPPMPGDYEQGAGVGATVGPATQEAAGRIVGAAEQGYRDTQPILTPAAQKAVE